MNILDTQTFLDVILLTPIFKTLKLVYKILGYINDLSVCNYYYVDKESSNQWKIAIHKTMRG